MPLAETTTRPGALMPVRSKKDQKEKGEKHVTDQPPLQLIIAHDRTRNEVAVVAHNQTPQQAQSHLDQWSRHLRPDCTFIVLAQAERHRTEEAPDCRACRQIVLRSAHLDPQPKFKRRRE